MANVRGSVNSVFRLLLILGTVLHLEPGQGNFLYENAGLSAHKVRPLISFHQMGASSNTVPMAELALDT